MFTKLLAAAFAQRSGLLAQLHAEGTTAYRLFHGSTEGIAGLTVDRYGMLLLIQSFHQSLTQLELETVQQFYAQVLPDLKPVYNDRSAAYSRIQNALAAEHTEAAHQTYIANELGLQYHIRARHEGQDPWLFLDLRATRRYILAHAQGKSVLNLFAYTCGVGMAAAKGGARQVVNIDFSASSLAVGQDNARLNDLSTHVEFIQSDAFSALRQLCGIGQATRVRGKILPAFPKLAPALFDLVLLDPPRYAKSPFGVVDLVNDYPAIFKLALLSTKPGGQLICCNNVAQVPRQSWLEQLYRSAQKAGRPIHSHTWILPEADFPSPDGNPPLKTVVLSV